MITEILLALVLPPLMLAGWAFVQFAWRRQMTTGDDDADALALRGSGCGSCGCKTPCEKSIRIGEGDER